MELRLCFRIVFLLEDFVGRTNPSLNARPLLLLLLLLFWIEELRTRCGDAGDNQATCDRGSEGRPRVSVVRQ